MNRKEFIAKIADIMDSEEKLTIETNLPDIEEWDSIAIMSTVALMDSLGKKVTVDDIKNVSTMKELVDMAGIDE